MEHCTIKSGVFCYYGGGLGDRHQQIVDGVTTNYTLDLKTGLTQVLVDETNTYLYGNGRIAQAGSTTEYFLGDALGSVRQLADPAGAVTLTQSYTPYGETVSSVGSGYSAYQYTGEIRDANGLTYLRARYLDNSVGRFISRDTWSGNYNRPLSLNRWNYVEGNPIVFTDPSGYIKEADAQRAELILSKLNTIYNIQIRKDWGYLHELASIGNLYIDVSLGCEWIGGNWRTLQELELTLDAIKDVANKTLGNPGRFRTIMGGRAIKAYRTSAKTFLGGGAYALGRNYMILPDAAFNFSDKWAKGQIVHEIAHLWDFRQNPKYKLSDNMVLATKSFKEICMVGYQGGGYCHIVYDPNGENEAPPTTYAQNNSREDWAESFKFFVYSSFGNLGPIRKSYIQNIVQSASAP